MVKRTKTKANNAGGKWKNFGFLSLRADAVVDTVSTISSLVLCQIHAQAQLRIEAGAGAEHSDDCFEPSESRVQVNSTIFSSPLKNLIKCQFGAPIKKKKIAYQFLWGEKKIEIFFNSIARCSLLIAD